MNSSDVKKKRFLWKHFWVHRRIDNIDYIYKKKKRREKRKRNLKIADTCKLELLFNGPTHL